jgi:hypothetical protein
MLNTLRQWLLRVLTSPVQLTAGGDQALEDVPFRSTSSIVVYDENLLERSLTQWQFGDWENLARLERDTLQHHPDRAKLALLAASGRLQNGQDAEAKAYIRLAQDWGVSKNLLTRILAAGVHNSLGRAAAIAGEQQRASQHFHSSVATGTPGGETRLLAKARFHQQYQQVGLPAPESANRNLAPKP